MWSGSEPRLFLTRLADEESLLPEHLPMPSRSPNNNPLPSPFLIASISPSSPFRSIAAAATTTAISQKGIYISSQPELREPFQEAHFFDLMAYFSLFTRGVATTTTTTKIVNQPTNEYSDTIECH